MERNGFFERGIFSLYWDLEDIADMSEFTARNVDYRRVCRVFENDPFDDEIGEEYDKICSVNELGVRDDLFGCKNNVNCSYDSGIQQGGSDESSEETDTYDGITNQLSEDSNLTLATVVEKKKSGNDNFPTISRASSAPSETFKLVEEIYCEKPLKIEGKSCSGSSDSAHEQPCGERASDSSERADNDPTSVQPATTESCSLCSDESARRIVIAIDIGTAFSGYAFSCPGQRDTNLMKLDNDDREGKVPSVLLLNDRAEFHSFGYKAIENYTNMRLAEAIKFLYFDKFKMQLRSNTEIKGDFQIRASNGETLPAVLLYTRMLSFFKIRALRQISKALGHPISEYSVKWVLTVPIIWSYGGKMFMKEAAFNAGLYCPKKGYEVVVLYDSEAAFYFCQYERLLPSEEFLNTDSSTADALSEGYLVLDCGAYYSQLTNHVIRKEITEVEVIEGPEEIYGALEIMESFFNFMRRIFGDDFLSFLKTNCVKKLSSLISDFEKCLTQMTSENYFFIDRSITEIFKKRSRIEISEAINMLGNEYLSWDIECNAMRMQYPAIVQLVESTVCKIINTIVTAINGKNDSSIRTLFVVGAFGQNTFLQSELQLRFRNRVKVVALENGKLAVLKGAVYAGHVEENTKISPHSFAIGILSPFQIDIHPIEKLVIRDGKKWCCDLLDYLVKENQELKKGEIILRKYAPTNFDQRLVMIVVYSIENADSLYVTDKGVHYCGTLSMKLEPSNGSKKAKLLFQFTYSGCDFFASILNTLNGNLVKVQLDSLSYL